MAIDGIKWQTYRSNTPIGSKNEVQPTQNIRGIGQVIKDKMNNQSPAPAATPAPTPAATPSTNQFGTGRGELRGDWATQYGRQEAATNRAAASNANLGMRDAVQRTANAGFSAASDVGQRAIDSSQAIAGSQRLEALNNLGSYKSDLLRSQASEAKDILGGSVSEKQKQFLASVAAQGGDVNAAMQATLNPDGTLKAEFADPSAAQVKLKGIVEEIQLANPNMSAEQAQQIAVSRLQAEQMTAEQAAKQQTRQADFQNNLDKAISSGDFGFIGDNITSMDEAQKSQAIQAMKSYATQNKLTNASQFLSGSVPVGMPVIHNGKVYLITRGATTDGMWEDSRRLYGINPLTGQEEEITRKEY